MKEIVNFDCPAGKSIIETMAETLFKEMVARHQVKASAEYDIEEYDATIKMTIDIIL